MNGTMQMPPRGNVIAKGRGCLDAALTATTALFVARLASIKAIVDSVC